MVAPNTGDARKQTRAVVTRHKHKRFIRLLRRVMLSDHAPFHTENLYQLGFTVLLQTLSVCVCAYRVFRQLSDQCLFNKFARKTGKLPVLAGIDAVEYIYESPGVPWVQRVAFAPSLGCTAIRVHAIEIERRWSARL